MPLRCGREWLGVQDMVRSSAQCIISDPETAMGVGTAVGRCGDGQRVGASSAQERSSPHFGLLDDLSR